MAGWPNTGLHSYILTPWDSQFELKVGQLWAPLPGLHTPTERQCSDSYCEHSLYTQNVQGLGARKPSNKREKQFSVPHGIMGVLASWRAIYIF